VAAWLCGVDGFKGAWCVVLKNADEGEFRFDVVPFRSLLELAERPSVIAIDVPIGLPDVTQQGGRTCDSLAPAIVGRYRACSVFSPVGRIALLANSRPEADKLSRAKGGIGIGAQAWGLAKKLQEVDALMSPVRQQIIREVHPELSFHQMLGRRLSPSKKTPNGKQERIAALVKQGFPQSFVREVPRGLDVRLDDFLDACAALWTAERIYQGTAKRIPKTVERDSRGLDMAMWF
jgi:predicted RNase H-like nuclease